MIDQHAPGSELSAGLLDVVARIAAFTSKEPLRDNAAVTRSQLLVLRSLSERGEQTMFELAGGVGVTAPTMTSTVKILLKKGLVDRRHGEEDWRTVVVNITDAGQVALSASTRGQNLRLDAAIALLTAEQRALLMLSLPALQALARQLIDKPAEESRG